MRPASCMNRRYLSSSRSSARMPHWRAPARPLQAIPTWSTEAGGKIQHGERSLKKFRCRLWLHIGPTARCSKYGSVQFKRSDRNRSSHWKLPQAVAPSWRCAACPNASYTLHAPASAKRYKLVEDIAHCALGRSSRKPLRPGFFPARDRIIKCLFRCRQVRLQMRLTRRCVG